MPCVNTGPGLLDHQKYSCGSPPCILSECCPIVIFMFPRLKATLKGKRFRDIQEIKQKTMVGFKVGFVGLLWEVAPNVGLCILQEGITLKVAE